MTEDEIGNVREGKRFGVVDSGEGQHQEGAELTQVHFDKDNIELKPSRDVFWVNVMNVFREMLSSEDSSPIDEVIKYGLVPMFVDFLSKDHSPDLQFAACWVLGNIASGTSDHTKEVIDRGAVPNIIKLLGSPNADIREQAVWALGNVAGDCPMYRDFVLGEGTLTPLLEQLNEHATLSMLRNLTLTLLTLCRGKPRPPFEQVRGALPALQILLHFDDQDMLSFACWALSCLSDGSDDKIQAVIEAGVFPRLVELIAHPLPCVQIPAVRTVRNVARGGDRQRRAVIGDNLIKALLSLLGTDLSDDVKKELGETVESIISGGRTAEAILDLQDLVKGFCFLLDSHDTWVLNLCLEGLETFCKCGAGELKDHFGYNYFAQVIDQALGIDKVWNLWKDDDGNNAIREKASTVWKLLYEEFIALTKDHEKMAALFSGRVKWDLEE